MKPKRIEIKLHYILKYFILALPLIMMLSYSLARETTSLTYINNIETGILSLLTNANTMLNNSYTSVLTLLGINIPTNAQMLYYYPLWIVLVYIVDLIVDILVFLPKMAHHFLSIEGANNYE